MMPPDADKLMKLRISRLYLLEKIEEEREPFDREILETIRLTVEAEIRRIENERRLHNGKTI